MWFWGLCTIVLRVCIFFLSNYCWWQIVSKLKFVCLVLLSSISFCSTLFSERWFMRFYVASMCITMKTINNWPFKGVPIDLYKLFSLLNVNAIWKHIFLSRFLEIIKILFVSIYCFFASWNEKTDVPFIYNRFLLVLLILSFWRLCVFWYSLMISVTRHFFYFKLAAFAVWVIATYLCGFLKSSIRFFWWMRRMVTHFQLAFSSNFWKQKLQNPIREMATGFLISYQFSNDNRLTKLSVFLPQALHNKPLNSKLVISIFRNLFFFTSGLMYSNSLWVTHFLQYKNIFLLIISNISSSFCFQINLMPYGMVSERGH